MANQQQVEIAAKLYECREQQVSIRGEEKFKAAVAQYKPLFTETMEANECSELQALIKLLERARGHKEEGLLMHVLNAVACELVEPKYTLTAQNKTDKNDQRIKRLVGELM
jgi:recombination associated protein RdgC